MWPCGHSSSSLCSPPPPLKTSHGKVDDGSVGKGSSVIDFSIFLLLDWGLIRECNLFGSLLAILSNFVLYWVFRLSVYISYVFSWRERFWICVDLGRCLFVLRWSCAWNRALIYTTRLPWGLAAASEWDFYFCITRSHIVSLQPSKKWTNSSRCTKGSKVHDTHYLLRMADTRTRVHAYTHTCARARAHTHTYTPSLPTLLVPHLDPPSTSNLRYSFRTPVSMRTQRLPQVTNLRPDLLILSVSQLFTWPSVSQTLAEAWTRTASWPTTHPDLLPFDNLIFFSHLMSTWQVSLTDLCRASPSVPESSCNPTTTKTETQNSIQVNAFIEPAYVFIQSLGETTCLTKDKVAWRIHHLLCSLK